MYNYYMFPIFIYILYLDDVSLEFLSVHRAFGNPCPDWPHHERARGYLGG